MIVLPILCIVGAVGTIIGTVALAYIIHKNIQLDKRLSQSIKRNARDHSTKRSL